MLHYFQGQDFNTSGENVMSLTNDLGVTYNFYGSSSLQISVQLDGFVSYTDAEAVAKGAVVNVTSLTIE